MDVNRADVDAAARAGLIDTAKTDALWAFLAERHRDTPRFTFTHVLYYLGGLIAIGAMTLFMTLGWEEFGGWGLSLIALVYGTAALKLAGYFLDVKRLAIPAGIMATLAVALTPLAIYGLQQALGLWPPGYRYPEYHTHIDWRWLMMELATLAVGAILLWRYRFPFMVMPVAVTLWYISMDVVEYLYGGPTWDWELRRFVSLWFGLAMVLLAFWIDLRSRHDKDYAFWLYLFGMLTFWGRLSLMRSGSELGKFLYFCLNVGLIFVGAALSRRMFAVFGGLGVAGYLGYLSHRVFRDSMVFPFALTLIGLGVIGLGILWQRHEARLSRRLREALPQPLRELIEARQS